MRPTKSEFRFAAYVLLAAAGIFGFWRQQDLSEELEAETKARTETVDKESQQRAVAICESNNDVREVITKLVNRTGGTTAEIDLETIEDPQLREIIRQSREESEEFRAEATTLLAKQNCKAL